MLFDGLWGVKRLAAYLGHKLELNDFSGVGLNAIRRKSEGAIEADLDDVYCHIGLSDCCCSEQECRENGVQELHFG